MSTKAAPQQQISIRDFSRNMPSYRRRVRAGESFVVMNQKVADFVVSPAPKKKKYTMKDMLAFTFKGGKNLSMEVDEIVYGTRAR
jgi:antitoxin (DNA-binding transcriptional repressor) of toxin-antitoxin stability system